MITSNEQQLAIVRLFKSVVTEPSTPSLNLLKYGVIVPSTADEFTKKYIVKTYGITKEDMNKTLRTFDETLSSSAIDLMFKQCLHYFTTYGYEALGVSGPVYIPREENIFKGVEVKFINFTAITEKEVRKKLISLCSSMALSAPTIENILVLKRFFTKEDVLNITNREVKTALYKEFDIVPEDPEEFLRYVIYRCTRLSLKIKNKRMYDMIKTSPYTSVADVKHLFELYGDYDKLASIFYRNKMLFLAFRNMRGSAELNPIINHIRRLADKNHKPVRLGLLDNLGNVAIRTNKGLDAFAKAFEQANLYKKFKVINYITSKMADSNAHMYRVRNGKVFAKRKENKKGTFWSALLGVAESILAEEFKFLKGKKVYLPEDTVYALPTSDKQFVGYIPSGSYIRVPATESLTFGIMWNNYRGKRVDLDIHASNQFEHYGWNGSWKGSSLIFSGDMTDAKEGAAELYTVRNKEPNTYRVTLNDYTCHGCVPYKFVLSSDSIKENKSLAAKDVTNIIAQVNLQMRANSAVIGNLVIHQNGEVNFVFEDFIIGCYDDFEVLNTVSEYFDNREKTQYTLNRLLRKCGVEYVDNAEEADIDLSLNALTKDTFVELFTEAE